METKQLTQHELNNCRNLFDFLDLESLGEIQLKIVFKFFYILKALTIDQVKISAKIFSSSMVTPSKKLSTLMLLEKYLQSLRRIRLRDLKTQKVRDLEKINRTFLNEQQIIRYSLSYMYIVLHMFDRHCNQQQIVSLQLLLSKKARMQNDYYFQKQSSLSAKCGLCALNNLIGTQYFKTQQLDGICSQLSSDLFNPYKSILGGDYDVTVLINALNKICHPVRWLKKDELIEEVLSCQLLKGFLINTQQKNTSFWKKLIDRSGRHWLAVKKWKDKFMLLDSMKESPQFFQNIKDIANYLQNIKAEGGTILIVELEKAQQNQIKQEFGGEKETSEKNQENQENKEKIQS